MKYIPILIITLLLLTPLLPANAGLVPRCATQDDPSGYSNNICCMLYLVSNFAKWLLGVIGAVALLMFIIGGVIWITSAGNTERVTRGKDMMVQTIIAIIIILVAWTLVNFIVVAFVSSNAASSGQQASRNLRINLQGMNEAWYEICIGQELAN